MLLQKPNSIRIDFYSKNPNNPSHSSFFLLFQNKPISLLFNVSFLNLLKTISSHDPLLLSYVSLENFNLSVKKNNYFSSFGSFNFKRSFIYSVKYKYMFLFRYKFSKFFKIINLKTKAYFIKKLNLGKKTFFYNIRTSKPLSPLFNRLRSTFFTNKNYFFLLGNLNNPYSWNLNNFKLLNPNESLFLKKKPKYSLKTKKKNVKSIFFLNKKMFLNNFFYLSKNKLLSQSSLLKNFYFVKNKIKKKIKKNLSKPYLFMNNNSIFKVSSFLNKKIYNNFKKSSKIYNFLKKLNFKKKYKAKLILFKNTNNFLFKANYSFIRKTYSLSPKKLYYRKTPNPNTGLKSRTYLLSKMKNKSIFKRKTLTNLKTSKFLINVNFYNFISRSEKYKFSFLSPKNYRFKVKKLIKLKKFNLIFFSNIANRVPPVKHFFFNNYSLQKSLNFDRYYTAQAPQSLYSHYKKNKSPVFNIFKKLPILIKVINKDKIKEYYSNKFKINTKTKYNTTFGLNGFLFLTSISYFSSIRNESIFLLKKTLYSFSYKNEMQRYILRKYLKNKFISVPEKFNTQKVFGSSSSFLKKFSITSNNFYSTPVEFLSSSFSLLTGYISNRKWLSSTVDERYSTSLFDVEYTFSIKRIKFKPGYMTMWRSARETLKTILDLKFKYQSKLTKYLFKFKKANRLSSFIVLEMRLSNILFKSKILPDTNYVDLFIKNNIVYVNGLVCTNPSFHLFVGDFIQLIINSKYYIMHRWMLHWSIQKKTRLKLKTKKKMSNNFLSDDKQQSNLMPNWILKNKNLITDVSKFVEVDYFTLSVFVIYEPFNLLDINPYNFISTRYGVINLYNWKYIT